MFDGRVTAVNRVFLFGGNVPIFGNVDVVLDSLIRLDRRVDLAPAFLVPRCDVAAEVRALLLRPVIQERDLGDVFLLESRRWSVDLGRGVAGDLLKIG